MEITCDPDEPGVCPHCLQEQSDIADDFVIPGRTGTASRGSSNSQCEHCDGWFSAYRNPGTAGLITFDQQGGE